MAIITFNVPNRAADAICTKFGYTGFLPDRITPQSKQEFFKAHYIREMKADAISQEAATAAATAYTTTANDGETNIIIT